MELSKEYIQGLRQEYRSSQLIETEADPHPVQLFKKWFSEAVNARLYEPNVMTLATADASGQPSARIVLLKGFDEAGFTFFTNYESRKGKQLAENPRASLVFFWAELERQVRIEGVVDKVDAKVSDDYFHSRPQGSQIGAVASPQSEIIDGRELLENKVETLTELYSNTEIPRPEHWGGYLLKPLHMEFWQGRPSRLHDRLSYDLLGDQWAMNRLAP